MAVYIKRLAVVRKHWLLEDDFQQGVALCQAMPGATAMQCSAYVGLRTRRLGGAAAAYLGFGLPAFALMLVRPIAYQQAVGVPAVVSTMTGLRALVVALVANAAWTFGRSSISNIREGLISGFAAALLLRKVDVVWVVLVGGVVSALVI